MSLLWPTMLLSLLLIPALIGFLLTSQARRRRLAARYGGQWLAPQAASGALGFRRHIPAALFLLGLALMSLAMARPQATVSVPRVEGIVILAFDVSGSMAAEDVEPSRMEAAKTAAQEFVQDQPPGVRVGVVAFSDSGFSVQAPTNDREAILATLRRLVPQRGTSLANGIFASLNALAADGAEAPRLYTDLTPAPTPSPTPVPEGTFSPAVIVLITDGENNEAPDPLAAAQAAADRGVRIHTVGVGSAAGTTLNVDGFLVHTALDEAALQTISRLTDGTYYKAEDAEDLRAIYRNLDLQWVTKPEKMEVTSILAGAGMVVLLIAGAGSLLWLGRLP